MKVLVAICLFGLVATSMAEGECVISEDCNNHDGRALCYNQECHRDVPCNKDNDCFFWAAADVAMGHPHPECYDVQEVKRAPGYGTCVLKEHAGNKYDRIPGDDVAALEDFQS
ncbi:uncharacterized protein LOC135471653 [Liolophura sinensis]|uniref:uncharacterized protein LOC135471653 n=1 Tax=Liolophura sinensis TaxID=3198878 RepID=UPI00315979D5